MTEKKKPLVCIKCPECLQNVCGTSQAQAEANLSMHRKSNEHKAIMKFKEASGAITRTLNKAELEAIKK